MQQELVVKFNANVCTFPYVIFLIKIDLHILNTTIFVTKHYF